MLIRKLKETIIYSAALLILCLLFLPVHSAGSPGHPAKENKKFLVIILDGLRPDYVTPELMPVLYNLAQEGIVAKNHHVIFPTVTRVNSPSVGSGTYPGTHGLMHNSIYVPEFAEESFSAGGAQNLFQMEPILTIPSFGNLLAENGKTIFVASSGSTGTSLLLNPAAAGAGIWNARGFVLPEEHRDYAKQLIGEFPKRMVPNASQNRWAVDAFLKAGLDEYDADVTLMWINDPDGTAHKHGIGDEITNEALRHVDEEIGRILNGLRERKLLEKTNILVSADHGFSTRTGGFNITEILEAKNLMDGVRVVGNAQIYIEDQDQDKLEDVVRALQESPVVGAIFTWPTNQNEQNGLIEGTLSMDLISYTHDRAPDVLVSASWSHAENEHGYQGSSTQDGVAGHGTTSPYELQINMIASGPDFKNNAVSEIPTGHVDIVPTILGLLNIPQPDYLDGRFLEELTVNGPDPGSLNFEVVKYESFPVSWNPDYKMVLHKARYGDFSYFQEASIER